MRKCVQLESKTHEKIQALIAICGCKSYDELISLVINPMYEAFSYYKSGKVEAYPLASRGQIIYQLYPKQNFVTFGQNQVLNEILGSA
jgi:hypothetical protein